MAKKLFEMAAEIVHAQATIGHMSPEDIQQALAKSFIMLQKMQKAEDDGTLLDLETSSEKMEPESAAQEKSEPKDSIQEDKIVCLECGAEMRQLTAKHLGAHELTPREYKKKYGFSLKQPLSAKSLTKARSKAAKKRGLPENLVKFQEERKQKRKDLMAPESAPAGEPEGAPTKPGRKKSKE